MDKYIRNVEHNAVIDLMKQVDYLPGQIVSKTLAQNKAVSLTLFAFDQGEEISSHESDGDAMVSVFDGVGQVTISGEQYMIKAGESIVMPAGKPHAVYAPEKFKMLLTVIFPKDNS